MPPRVLLAGVDMAQELSPSESDRKVFDILSLCVCRLSGERRHRIHERVSKFFKLVRRVLYLFRRRDILMNCICFVVVQERFGFDAPEMIQ